MTEPVQNAPAAEPADPPPPEKASFWSRHKGEIGLALLLLYVFLLVLGTLGELFDIEWILDLPLFRPPGKY